MVFGAMLAASDPVLVFAGMTEIGADRLTTFTSAESIMNDGPGGLLFTPLCVCGAVFEDDAIHAGELESFIARHALGAAILRLCSLFSVLVLKLCGKETVPVWTFFIRSPPQYQLHLINTRSGMRGSPRCC